MKKYRVRFYREELLDAEIYASNEREAREMFERGDILWTKSVPGSEMVDEVVEVEELNPEKEAQA